MNESNHHPEKKTSTGNNKASGQEKTVTDDELETNVSSEINSQSTQKNAPDSKLQLRHHTQNNTATEKSGLGRILNNRFELLEKIGSGGMGMVYKALDLRDIEAGTSQFIAIKVLRDEYKDDPRTLKALHSEARKTRKLAHPNIVTVYDLDRDQDMVYMTMEFLEGVTLRKLIKAHPDGLEPALAIKIIEQLSEALSYAHSHQVIHSDFKPGNIIIDKNNHVKVLDFGVARMVDYARVNEFDAGVLGGMTQIYASLEMLNSQDPDQNDDVYSLACVVYELFAGKHPFNGLSAEQAQHKDLKPERIGSLNQGQWRALKQALELKREKRTKTVRELLRGLHSVSNKTLNFTIVGVLVVLLLYLWNLGLMPDILQSNPGPLNEKASAESKTWIRPIETAAQPSKPAVVTPQIKIYTDKTTYHINDPFIVSFSVSKPTYVRLVVVNSNGKVSEIFPNTFQENNYCLPETNYHIPPVDSDIILVVHGPVGIDKIIAVASSEPFPDGVMTLQENGKLVAEDKPEKFTVAVLEYKIE